MERYYPKMLQGSIKFKHLIVSLLTAVFMLTGLGTVNAMAPQNTVIPGTGGTVRVNGFTEFSFTPGSTGFWRFETSDNGDSDPLLWLFDNEGTIIDRDDDGAGDLNALIVAYLVEGKQYLISADFFADGGGSYTLEVTKAEIVEREIRAGDTVVNEETFLLFTPEHTGLWEIRTMNRVDCDPMLWLLDENGALITMDDDSAGDLNALITAYLEAGTQYIIRAGFWSNPGTYTVRVQRSQADEFPSEGGAIFVDSSTVFTFTPERSGLWEIAAVKDMDSNPQLWLYDGSGQLITIAEGYDIMGAYILAFLEEGEQYVIRAQLMGNWGSFNLQVIDTEATQLPVNRGSVVIDSLTYFYFTPTATGVREFRTTNNNDSDPCLWLFDENGKLIAFDDDSANNFNALIRERLSADQRYIIVAGFFAGEGSYTLQIR